jgi:subtilisin family serine protease
MFKNLLTGCLIATAFCSVSPTVLADTLNDPMTELQQALTTPTNSKLQGGLDALASPAPSAAASVAAPPATSATTRSVSPPSIQLIAPSVSDGYVAIDAIAQRDKTPELVSQLTTLGMQDIHSMGQIVSGSLPVSQLSSLNNVAGLSYARPSMKMITNYQSSHHGQSSSGLVQSQGVKAMQADKARQFFRVDGKGVPIGVISDSYNCLGGAEKGVTDGDLPANVNVLQERSCTKAPATDEGRALMEILHDVAPASPLMFYSGQRGEVGSEVEFALGILNLAAAGAKVIMDDAFYPMEPMFQDGIITQVIDKVKSQGVAYFSAAGNYGREATELTYAETLINYFGLQLNVVDFNPGSAVDDCLAINVPFNAFQSSLQWDEPFVSLGGAGASNNFGVLLYTNADCAGAHALFIDDYNLGSPFGNDPMETFGIGIPDPSVSIGVLGIRVVRLNAATTLPSRMKMAFYSGVKITDANAPRSGTLVPHANSRSAMAVGAAYYKETPAFGTRPAKIEPFSSAGITPILFDTAGQRLAKPVLRQQPALVAPDGVDTSFFGGGDTDQSGFPNFLGTSAATPHAAGVAALMRQANPKATPDTIYQLLKRSSQDMDDPSTPRFDRGFDYATGYGFINALEAVSQAHACRK